MKELEIKEQKNIYGGKVNYYFEDYTTNLTHQSVSLEKAYSVRKKLIAKGHKCSAIWDE